MDTAGNFVARRVRRYVDEGFWQSDNPAGVRGKVGAYHRTLSSYLNGLVSAGLVLRTLAEPTIPPGEYDDPYTQGQVQVPSVLVVDCLRPAAHPDNQRERPAAKTDCGVATG